MRVRISRAALLVKVTASRDQGARCSTWISQAMRCTRTRVLPLPAPANTSRLPPVAVTASRWGSLRGARMWDMSSMAPFYS